MASTQVPVYIELYNTLISKIISKQIEPNQQLPSVRELSLEYKINPNTIQKTLNMLDSQGITYIERGQGRYLTSDLELLENIKNKFISELVQDFIEWCRDIGIEKDEIIKIIERGILWIY